MKLFEEGDILEGPEGSVVVAKNENKYGDTFFYVGLVTDHTEDGEVIRTRDGAIAYARRRGWLPEAGA